MKTYIVLAYTEGFLCQLGLLGIICLPENKKIIVLVTKSGGLSIIYLGEGRVLLPTWP